MSEGLRCPWSRSTSSIRKLRSRDAAMALLLPALKGVGSVACGPWPDCKNRRSAFSLLLNMVCAKPVLRVGLIGGIKAYLGTIRDPRIDTLLIDEAAGALREEVLTVLNAGYKRGATAAIMRAAKPQAMKTSAPVAAAWATSPDDIPESLASRSIVISMQRRSPEKTIDKTPGKQIAQLPILDPPEDSKALEEQLKTWGRDAKRRASAELMRKINITLPDGVRDRTEEIWTPLLAVAADCGGLWPDLASAALEKVEIDILPLLKQGDSRYRHATTLVVRGSSQVPPTNLAGPFRASVSPVLPAGP
ncbi:MAG: DUF3631 domain-containing protein [Acidimicrobiales bacterium]